MIQRYPSEELFLPCFPPCIRDLVIYHYSRPTANCCTAALTQLRHWSLSLSITYPAESQSKCQAIPVCSDRKFGLSCTDTEWSPRHNKVFCKTQVLLDLSGITWRLLVHWLTHFKKRDKDIHHLNSSSHQGIQNTNFHNVTVTLVKNWGKRRIMPNIFIMGISLWKASLSFQPGRERHVLLRACFIEGRCSFQ